MPEFSIRRRSRTLDLFRKLLISDPAVVESDRKKNPEWLKRPYPLHQNSAKMYDSEQCSGD